MGCKQYARMLGLSRGYPHILYLSLIKWDAAPSPPLFHKAVSLRSRGEKIRWHDESVPPGSAIDCRTFPWLVRPRSQQFAALTPASRRGPRCDASDLKWENSVCSAGAVSQRQNPWLRRHPQKSHEARFSACRRRIPQDNRLCARYVHVRAHPGTPGVR